MKQFIRLYTLLIVSCLLTTGCESDKDADPLTDPVPIQFNMTRNSPQAITRANEWTQNDRIGVYMIQHGQTLSDGTIAEGAKNIPYQAQTGEVAQADSLFVTPPIYYPRDVTEKVDFISYYPYNILLSSYTLPVHTSNQTQPALIDILYVHTVNTNSNGYNKNSGMVDLGFNHALSKISFNLISGTGSPNLAGATITIGNLCRSAKLSLVDGSVSDLTDVGTITVNATTQSAIVIPQTSSPKLVVTLADGINKFEWDFPSNTQFLPSSEHPYNITVNRTGITVSPVSINPWDGVNDPPKQGTGQIVP